MINKLLALCLALFSFSVYAHPGHDHNHWLSHFIHFTLALAVVGVVAVAVHFYRRNKQLKTEEK